MCGENKPETEFGLKKVKPHYTYLQPKCKPCHTKYNLDNRKKVGRKKGEKERENAREWSRNHFQGNKNNPQFRSRRASYAAKRRAHKINATPEWLTEDHHTEIKNLYWLASDLKLVTGENYHVDHIIPLKGKSVCGLHVPWNLQVLPADINHSKGNRHGDSY